MTSIARDLAEIVVPPIEQFDHANIDWLGVERCPLCDAPPLHRSPLVDCGYMFGDERIAFPRDGIDIASCGDCGLYYKTRIPTPASLSQVMERQAGKKWMEPYDFRNEIEEIKNITSDTPIDVLDVGCGSGGLLSAWAPYSRGRRSALDVVQHPGCTASVDGEFIHGLIDEASLSWSQAPYDLITVFDVLEHLYSPGNAFANLHELLKKDGLLIIETGNVESTWPMRHGVNHWWYARLFEHHLFWSRSALEYVAAQYGLRLLVWRDVRHKSRASSSLASKLNDAAQVGLYRITPTIYPKIAPLIGKYWTQPWSPFTHDHFRVVLRKP